MDATLGSTFLTSTTLDTGTLYSFENGWEVRVVFTTPWGQPSAIRPRLRQHRNDSPASLIATAGVSPMCRSGAGHNRRSGAGRQLVRRIGHRRVKVRWVTPLGDETASTSYCWSNASRPSQSRTPRPSRIGTCTTCR
jgi:hypothetical protein